MTDQAVALFGEQNSVVPTYASAAGAIGNENVNADDLARPYLKVLNGLSPEVGTSPGALPGKLYNTLNEKVYDEVYLVNLTYTKEYPVWKKQALGGGLQGIFSSQAAAEDLIPTLDGKADDYDIIETARHTCMMLDEEGSPTGLIDILLKKSGLGVSRNWNSQLLTENNNAPRFSTVWTMGTEEKSAKTFKWHTFKPTLAGWAPEDTFEACKQAYESITRTQ